jgi:5-(carboxyamino)imidazole ribonucleotide synthase
MSRLATGSTVGVLGSGQLGRMMALAAAPLGYRVHVYAPDAGCAGAVSARATQAGWGDLDALEAFARSVDVITLEFENVPVDAVRHLARFAPVRPGAAVLAVCQDRVAEKSFLRDAGIATAPWRPASCASDVAAAVAELGPAVLKTSRAGYDGKGQARVKAPEDAAAAWAAIGSPSGAGGAIVEGFVPFIAEASVVVARGVSGEVAAYELVENVHRDHVLWQTRVPAPFGDAVRADADRIARRVVEALDLTGLIAVELFVMADGSLRVNELAPRPHNSGHWSIDAARTSQFEQAIRAVTGCPLGDPSRHHDAVMTNLLGADVALAEAALAEAGARVHLYDKGDARPGRKMGHITRLGQPAAP